MKGPRLKLGVGKSRVEMSFNPSGDTPLHFAAEKGHLKICKQIIEKISAKNPENDNGWTPLHLAAQNKHMELCKLIHDHIKNNDSRSNLNEDLSCIL